MNKAARRIMRHHHGAASARRQRQDRRQVAATPHFARRSGDARPFWRRGGAQRLIAQILASPETARRARIILVPDEGIEPPTFGLQNRCSTAELIRRLDGLRAAP
jgi:hypothetical protein